MRVDSGGMTSLSRSRTLPQSASLRKRASKGLKEVSRVISGSVTRSVGSPAMAPPRLPAIHGRWVAFVSEMAVARHGMEKSASMPRIEAPHPLTAP